jgi:hypothetical protein
MIGFFGGIRQMESGSWGLANRRPGATRGLQFVLLTFSWLGAVLTLALAASPVADPGKDQTVPPGVVHLDGSRSTSPSGKPLTYQWNPTGGPGPARLSSDTVATPSVELTVPGTYTFGLRVLDGKAMSQFTEVTITVQDLPPSCGAGPDQVVPTGKVTLAGWATDPNMTPLTTTWTQVQGPRPMTLSDSRSLTPTFTVPPDGTGIYSFVLHASDGTRTTQSTPVKIEANDLPEVFANANPQSVTPGRWTELNGSGSTDKNPEDNPITYHWTLANGPEPGEFSTPNDLYAKFRAKRAGDYEIRLTVREKTNQHEGQASTTVTIRNVAPAAKVGPPVAGHDQGLQLDGTGSSDENGDPLTYLWKQTDGPEPLEISEPTSPTPTVRARKPGEYKVSLVVNDGQTDSDPAVATVSIKNTAPFPIVTPFIAGRCGPLVLSGASSVDADGDRIRYLWTQVSGPVRVPLRTAGYPQLAVDLPVPGTYVFQLQVGDGVAWSFPARVQVDAR